MQIRIITLADTSRLVQQMRALFPNADVGIQRGIDVRTSPTNLLFSSDLITHSVVHTLQNGRRWHHEVPSKGAIGVAQANRLALEEDTSQPLLLLEDDCIVLDEQRLSNEVAHLLAHSNEFDMAVFGAKYKGKQPVSTAPWLPEGFNIIKDKFWLLHSVLYTPSGRAKVAALLQKPLEMQIDSLLGSEARMGNLTVVGQLHRPSTKQSIHPSNIQSLLPYPAVCKVYIPVAVFVLVLYLVSRKRRELHTR